MRNPFKIDESFTIRHKILGVLYADQDSTKICDKRVSSQDISDITGIPLYKIHYYHELLKRNNEIDCEELPDSCHHMFIKENGRYSFLERNYKKEGRKEVIEWFNDIFKIVLPLAAISISIITLVSTCQTKGRLQELEIQTQQSVPKK